MHFFYYFIITNSIKEEINKMKLYFYLKINFKFFLIKYEKLIYFFINNIKEKIIKKLLAVIKKI